MKRVYVREEWCLGCHLCEYNCAFANSGLDDMVKALKGKDIRPRIHVEDGENDVHFAVSCRHCDVPLCVKGCISGALTQQDGVISINREKCVGCYTCVLSCPYGAIMPSAEGAMQKCELCLKTKEGVPQCVKHCPNGAIVYEER